MLVGGLCVPRFLEFFFIFFEEIINYSTHHLDVLLEEDVERLRLVERVLGLLFVTVALHHSLTKTSLQLQELLRLEEQRTVYWTYIHLDDMTYKRQVDH